MKIFILSLFLSFGVYAYEGFRCAPSPKQTRVQILVVDNKIEMYVANPMGYDFMPQIEGPTAPFNFSFNKMQTDDLKDLANVFTFSWPKSQCQMDVKNFTIQCQLESLNKVGDIKSLGLSTIEVSEKNADQIYKKRRFRLSVDKGNIYFVSLEFPVESCSAFN